MSGTRGRQPKPRRDPSPAKGSRAAPIKITPAQRARALRLADALREHYPNAHCELTFRSPHELLIATILSAQATDASVNLVTPALFKAFPTPKHFADASPAEIEPYIRSIGLFRNKSRFIHLAMTALVNNFAGDVPRTMEQLLTLQGVARKTASVVLGNAFNAGPESGVGFVVDTHIERLSGRFCLCPKDANVATIERYLAALFPPERWCELSHQIIWHGRRVCKARGGPCEPHPICQEFGTCCERRHAVTKSEKLPGPKPTKPLKPTKLTTSAPNANSPASKPATNPSRTRKPPK